MSDRIRIKNGRFFKKEVRDKRLKALAAIAKAKSKVMEEATPENNNIPEGRRLVDLRELARNLKCSMCHQVLNLENTVEEINAGLHTVLKVLCN